jgi:flagellar biosynthesis protein FlhA
MTEQAKKQLANPTAFFVSGTVLIILGLVPGMPHFVFLTLGSSAIGLGYYAKNHITNFEQSSVETNRDDNDLQPAELDWDDVDLVDLIGLDIGYGLIPLVNTETGGQLLSRVKGVRKKLSAELGFLVQPIRIRDNLDLDPEIYHIVINGVVRGTGNVKVGKELAINPGHANSQLQGTPTKEPAFGLDAVWIEPAQKDYARTLGYTVVDSATAIATHLNTILRNNSSELLSHDEAQQLLDKVASKSPKLVEDLVPTKLTLATITKTLQNILAEDISLKDMRTIIEVLSSTSLTTQDPDALTAEVRPRLGRMIVQNLVDIEETLPVITLDPTLEQMLHNVLQQGNSSQGLVIEPSLAEQLFQSLAEHTETIENQGNPAVLVVSPSIRPWLSKVVRHRIRDLTVLSYNEIPDDQPIKVVATVENKNQN